MKGMEMKGSPAKPPTGDLKGRRDGRNVNIQPLKIICEVLFRSKQVSYYKSCMLLQKLFNCVFTQFSMTYAVNRKILGNEIAVLVTYPIPTTG